VTTWKDQLGDAVPADWGAEIDHFEAQMNLRKQGKIEDRVFAELRLRRGAYGQRYDNGLRHDGEQQAFLPFPNPQLTKGPDTLWEAPGMMRIKIPWGGFTASQLDVLADLGEEYSDGILHITTRQDVQLHYVDIEDTPDLMRRLAAVGITTREACGNSVRNVTACPLAGVCPCEAFDTTPYAEASWRFLLGHRDVQDFGRKFKIAFSGCADGACGLVSMHDMGFIARTREVDGRIERGFEVQVGGGLGAVPHVAKVLDPFVPEDEILPLTQAVARVYARLGEKKNRNKARIKFLVAKLGIDELRRLVLEERATLERDERWDAWVPAARDFTEPYLAAPADGSPRALGTDFDRWRERNVKAQRQPGFVAVTLALPLGDLTSRQARRLADVARRFLRDTMRTTVEQNIVLRWVHEADLPALYEALAAIGLARSGAESITDIVTCPGTDTCKLGISASRGLGGELTEKLAARGLQHDADVQNLRIKISGCFNSCGQHHVADIGFFGSSRTVGNYRVPHFQLILGGQWAENGRHFGQAMGAVPSKRVPEAVDRLLDLYRREKRGDESFRSVVERVGRKEIKALLDDLTRVPDHAEAPDFYVDWGDARSYSIGDIGVGECAGEVVSLTEFGIVAAESLLLEAQLALDDRKDSEAPARAVGLALDAMVKAAQALIKLQDPDVRDDGETVLREFEQRFHVTGLFHDRYMGGKFAQFLFAAWEERHARADADAAGRRIEEATLFLEAAYACHARMLAGEGTPDGGTLKIRH
jgi:sulfite reductase (ferredoxin)